MPKYLHAASSLQCEVDVDRQQTFETNGRVAPLLHGRDRGLRERVVRRSHDCDLADGAVLVNDRVKLRSGVFSVPYVDASGGGDAFDAGFIYGMLHGLSEEDCLRVASALGASCVRAIGTTPGVFTESECSAFLQEHALRIERI